MKKFLLLFIAVVLSFAFAFSASAEDVLDAKLNGFYAYNGENITVKAFFSEIKVKDGIISVEYDIEYDDTALELVSVEHFLPERWDALINEENVENFSFQHESGVYRWGYAVISLGEGAKADDELGISVEFKPIADKTSDIKITYSDLRGEVVESNKTLEFVHMSSNSIKVSFDPASEQNTKLFYADVYPDSGYRQNKYYEVENIVIDIPNGSEATEDNTVALVLSFIAIGLCLLSFILGCVYIFVKSKRG